MRRYRLVTSRDLAKAGEKHVDVPAGGVLTLAALEGRGRIVRLWLTLPPWGRRHALRDAVLRVFWDAETEPSVEVPLGDFFGAAFGKPQQLISERLLVVGGAYACRFEMPFNEGARVELHNQGSRALRTLFFQIGYYEEAERQEREATFHAQFRSARCRPGEPAFVALEAAGRGHLAGLRLELQNQSWWLKPPLSAIALPRGFGLGLLEGWERVDVDGDAAATWSGTGAEDYFSGGFYFLGGPFCTPSYGCTVRSFWQGRVAAYRLLVDDPISFASGLRVAFDHGLGNSMAGDYSSVAYWYQLEPHAPFLALSNPELRRPRLPWVNPIQWSLLGLLLASPVLIYLMLR